MTVFSRNLVEIRKRHNLSQAQLAEMLEVQPRLVSRWETGESKPQFDNIVQLATSLRVSLDQLILGERALDAEALGLSRVKNKQLENLCRQIDTLGKADQRVICQVMDNFVRQELSKATASATKPRGAK